MSEKTKPRVLIVHMSLYNGGAERSLINFLTALPPDVFDVDLLLFRTEGLFLHELPPHVRLLKTPEPLLSLYYNKSSLVPRAGGVRGLWYRFFRAAASVVSGVGAGKNDNLRRQRRWKWFFHRLIPNLPGEYDAAMAYFHGEVSYYVMDKVRAKRKVAWVHNDYDKTGQSPDIDRPYFARFAEIATISPLCANALQRAFPELAAKFTVVPNLTSASVVRAMSREFEPPEFDKSAPILLSVGRLNPQKACDLSVEAASLLKARGVAFRWYLLGDGGMRGTLERMIEEKGLTGQVVLLGARANPYPYMRACDVLVQNSRYEGKSVVLDEAKILGKPIVVTAYPTVADQIEADAEGLVVPLTAQGVAEGIERMLRDAKLRARLCQTLQSRSYDNTGEIARYVALLTGGNPDAFVL